MSQLFLSHSSSNNAEALALRDWLVSEGWTNLFLDLDPERGIVAGERWERALHQAASRCDSVLFLISRAWLGSEWCRRELHLAQKLNKRVFTLLVEDLSISELPAELTDSWQVVNLASGSDHGQAREVMLQGETAPRYVYFSQSGLQRLRVGLQKAGLDPHAFPWPPSNDPDRPPYRGLLPLEAEDAGIFFGREAPIIELLAQLRGLRESAPPRLLAILGASGAGKSSFLRAGVLPRLSRDDRHFLPLPVLRPERAVLSGKSGLVESLTAASRVLNRSRWDVQQAVEGGAESLRALLESLARHAAVPEADGQAAAAPTLVLCVDQGEELFLAEGGEEAARFLGLLRDLLMQESPPLMVLFTIRSDSYDRLQRAEELAGIRQQAFPLQPMPRGAYQQVIEEPAKLLARSHRPLHIDPKLTQALLDDLDKGGAKDALPLLAFTLERLYLNFGASSRLTLEDYRQKTQGIEGAIESAVNAALTAAQGNPRLPNDREECLKLLRRGLIPWLAGIDPQTNLPRRRVARLADVPEEARAIIQHFIEHRLLSTDKNGDGEVTVEPAHEALLRQWTKLKGWLEEDAAALSTLETVRAASRDWEANERDAKWLIHQAGRLEDAEALHRRDDLSRALTNADRDYLSACRRQENERRDRELQQARELADARLRALENVAKLEAQINEAATRAEGRARDAAIQRDLKKYAAFLAESLSYAEKTSSMASSELLLDRDGLAIHAMMNHEDGINCVKFSPDGRWVVTASRDKTARLWHAKTGQAVGEPMRHEEVVWSAQFSPDSCRIVTASNDNTACVWNVQSGTKVGAAMRHDDGVISAQFSPDGRCVVTASRDKTARLWDATTGEPLGATMHHDDQVGTAEFSPDGRWIVTSSQDETARIWDAKTGMPVFVLSHLERVRSACFSPDNRRVVTACVDKTARLWDVKTGKEINLLPHKDEVVSAQFSPDSRWVVTASRDNTARVWDAQTTQAVSTPIRHEDTVHSAVFSPDGRWVLTVSADCTARLWDAATGKAVGEPVRHASIARSADFSPDGRWVVTSDVYKSGYLWSTCSSQAINRLIHLDSVAKLAQFSSDSKNIATISRNDYVICIWNIQPGEVIGDPMRHGFIVNSVDFSPDGCWIVTASDDDTARIWNAQTGVAIAAPMRHGKGVKSAKFSPDGRWIVTASADCTAQIWDAKTGKAIGTPMHHGDQVNSANFSPNGRWIVTASNDRTAQIWDAQTGKPTGTSMHHGNWVNSVEFSLDGHWIVTASDDCNAQIWDAQTGKAKGEPMHHKFSQRSATFSPDGCQIITGGWGSTAQIWDALTGKPIGKPMQHGGMLWSAKFSPNSRWAVTSSDDGTAQIWEARTGLAVGVPMCHEGGVTSAEFSPDGCLVITTGRDMTVRTWPIYLDSGAKRMQIVTALRALYRSEINADGRFRELLPEEVMQAQDALRQTINDDTLFSKIICWHFADRSMRAISPLSKETVPEFIENAIASAKDSSALEDAYALDPGHPLILLAFAAFEKKSETVRLWKDLALERIAGDARLAVKAAEMLKGQDDAVYAHRAAKIALSLDAKNISANNILEWASVHLLDWPQAIAAYEARIAGDVYNGTPGR